MITVSIDAVKDLVKPYMNDDNSAQIVESIAAMDTYDTEADMVPKSTYDQIVAEKQAADAAWNERFRKAFFGEGEITEQETYKPMSDAGVNNEYTIDNMLYGKQ